MSPCQTLIQCGGLAETTVVLSLIMQTGIRRLHSSDKYGQISYFHWHTPISTTIPIIVLCSLKQDLIVCFLCPLCSIEKHGGKGLFQNTVIFENLMMFGGSSWIRKKSCISLLHKKITTTYIASNNYHLTNTPFYGRLWHVAVLHATWLHTFLYWTMVGR